MANIHDTLHPLTSPSDNLYPNINPVVNIPDESIPKRKMAFPIDSNGVTALIPTGTYVDIADLGIPGQVRFPSGTRYVYVQGGDVIATPDLGEDKIYGPGVTPEWKFEIIVYSKNSDSYIATRFNAGDNPVASVEDDDFVVMILMLSPVETGPQVIPIYSIIPFEFIRYNTQPYEKQLAQTMGIAAIDGSYADLGAGKDGDGNQISTTYAKQTGSYPSLTAGQAQILTEPYVVGVDTSTQTTGYVKFATVSLPQSYRVGVARLEILDKNYVNTQTSPCGVEFSVRNSDANNITLLALLLYGKSDYLSKIYACAKTGSYPITVDFYIDITSENPQDSVACIKPLFTYYRASNTLFSFITDNEIVSSLPTDTTNTLLSDIYTSVTEAFSAINDGDGNVIASTYAKTTGTYADLGAGKDGDENVIASTYAKTTGTYADLGAGKDGDGNVIASTYAKVGELSNETQLRTAADQAIMALIDDIEDGTTTVAKAARIVEVNGLSTDDLNEFFGKNYYGKIYCWEGGQTPVNAPPTSSGGALIINRIGATTSAQTYITARSSHETAPLAVYMRSRPGSAEWTDWEEIVSDSGVYENLGAGKDGEGNVISETYAKKSDIPTATRLYQHNVTIKNGDDAIITTTVLTSTSDVFSSVDDLITILGNEGFSVSSGPKLLPACGTVITAAGDTSVVYPVVGVGKYGNRVDAIGFYYFRQDVSVGRAGFQLLMNSSITYFNDTITQI